MIPVAEAAQEELPGIDASEPKGDTVDTLEGGYERKFKCELQLKLTPTEVGKAITIPLLAGEYFGKRVVEMLGLAMQSARNKKIIEAVLDNPEANGHAGDRDDF